MTAQQNDSLAVGVDAGGTHIRTALVDARGTVVDSERQPTEADQGPDHVIERLVETVRTLMDRTPTPVAALGIGIAGQIDDGPGTLLASPNLGWSDVDLKSPLEDALQVQVHITNDVGAAAWGEYRFGAGRDDDNMVCVWVGTGVGGGVISRGRLLEGVHGPSAELGHVPLVFDGRRCSCGGRGCLEAYAGGWAIAERARERVKGSGDAGEAIRSAAGTTDEITAEHVTTAFRSGDPLARSIVEDTRDYLAAAAVGMVNLFDPSVMVFGGGVIEALPELMETVEAVVAERALAPFATPFRTARAELGDDSGIIGAAALARERAG